MYLQPSKINRNPSPKILNFHGTTDKDGKVFLDFKREMAFYDSDEIAVVDLYMDVARVKNVHENQYSISAQALSDKSVQTKPLPAALVVTVENLATLVEGTLLGIRFSYGKDGNLIMMGNVHYTYTLPIVLARCLGFLEASGEISELVRDLNKRNVTISSRSTASDGIPNVVDVTFLLNGNGKLSLLHSKNRNIWNYVSKNSIQTIFLYCDLVQPVLVGSGLFEHLVHVPFPETETIISRAFHILTWQRVKKSFTTLRSITVSDSVGNKLPNISLTCNLKLKRRTFT